MRKKIEDFLTKQTELALWIYTIAFVVLILAAGILVAPGKARAEVSLELDGAAGVTHFWCTICDAQDSATATWAQMGLPNDLSRDRLSWRAGAVLHFTEDWAMPLYWLQPGTFKVRQHYTVDDAHYNPRTHACLTPCTNLGEFDTDATLHGISLAVRRSFHVGDWTPYVDLGMEVYHNHVSAGLEPGGTRTLLKGILPTAMGGAGVEHPLVDRVRGYAETSYHHGFGGGTDWSAGLPPSKEWISVLFGLRVRVF